MDKWNIEIMVLADFNRRVDTRLDSDRRRPDVGKTEYLKFEDFRFSI